MLKTRNFTFNKNPKISSLFTIRSANILGTIWEYLGRYKSKSYTKSILASQVIGNHNLIDKKSEQIAFTIRQAQDFFISARTSNISIKPLLIYYGILGLAKSLIISGDNKYTLEATDLDYSEHGLHGLSWKADTNDKNQVNTRDSDSLIQEFCSVKVKGIYPLFRQCYANTSVPKNTLINMQTLLSLIPEIWQSYYSFFSQSPRVYGCDEPKNGDVQNQGDNKQLIGGFNDYFSLFNRNNGETAEDCLNRLFPEIKTMYYKNNNSFISKNDVTALDSHIVFSKTKTLSAFALIQPYNNFKLTEFDIYFLLFYILSNICRYRQDKWFKITQRDAQIDEFFLIESLFEIVEYKFPLLILKELEGKDYNFIGDVATYG